MTDANADKQAADTGTEEEESAPQDKTSQDTGNEDSSPVGHKAKTAVRDIVKLREDRRQLREKTSGLESELKEIKEMLARSTSSEDKESSTTDIDKLKQELIDHLSKREQESTIAQKNAKANEMFGQLRWVQEDESFADEVQDALHRDYADILRSNPVAAVRLAYADVCRSRNVSEEVTDNSAARASGGAGSSAPSGKSPKADARDYQQIVTDTDWSDPESRAKAKERLAALKNSGK